MAGDRPAWDYSSDLRLVKAALLYADRVVVHSTRFGATLSAEGSDGARPTRVSGSGYPPEIELLLDRVATRLFGRPAHHQLRLYPDTGATKEAVVARASQALCELLLAVEAGLVQVDEGASFETLWWPLLDESLAVSGVPVMEVSDEAFFSGVKSGGSGGTPTSEGVLASTLIGQLEAFPEATMDVVLDVRERLTAARVRFRAAMSSTNRDLRDAISDGATMEQAIAEFRRREVDPALEDLRDELAALGARDSLLRVASNTGVVASALAGMSIVAGGVMGIVDVPALLAAVTGAPLVSAASKEALARIEVSRRAEASPYWLLHKAGDLLRRS